MTTDALQLQPEVLRWARERARLEIGTLAKKLGVKLESVADWEKTGELSFPQAEGLAHHTHTPIGYLFLDAPQDDRLPIPDFRTVDDQPIGRTSPDLLETLHAMQRRQNWMRDDLIEKGSLPLPFVDSHTVQSRPETVAADMLETLGLTRDWAEKESSWTDALRTLRRRVEDTGVLIVINGVVGNNTRRPLDPDEFRGFALCDPYVPLIFINGKDAKSAQMFTIAHELAHLWIGEGGVSNFDRLQPAPRKVELFCNKVAAEFLIPSDLLRECWDEAKEERDPWQFLARRFKVSPLVAARRALDLELITRNAFFAFYREHQEEQRKQPKKPGGDFWNTQHVRVGERFGHAVVRAVREERLLYRDAYRLVGMSGATFDKFAKDLGFDAP